MMLKMEKEILLRVYMSNVTNMRYNRIYKYYMFINYSKVFIIFIKIILL